MSVSLLPIRLYQVLLEYSDSAHPLSMGELRRHLSAVYGMDCDRRTVYAALEKLRYIGCDIPTFEDDKTGYRLFSRPMEPSEVRLLMDAVASFPGISASQCALLVDKLRESLSVYQRMHCRPLIPCHAYQGQSKEVFLVIELMEDAIFQKCQVQFDYMEYGMDKRLHSRRERPYQVHPYGLVFANGNYYLLCRYPGFHDLCHYRVDRIQHPLLLENQPVDPLPADLELSRYVRERVYQFSGNSVRAKLRCDQDMLSDVLDQFGLETQLSVYSDGTFDAVVTCEPNSLKIWCLQYLNGCELLEPLQLRRELGALLTVGYQKYT